MRMTRMVFLSGVALAVMVGFALSEDKSALSSGRKSAAAHVEQSVASVTNAKAGSDLPVIGYIEKRGRTITVRAGTNGPVYSVKTAEGKVLCDNLSKEQLSAQAPELREFLKTAVASTPGTKTDARLGIGGDASVRGAGRR
jgi:hypothetical protein